ncbi:ACP phosphodiesterase [Pseudoalteromonas sp. YIC-656]|uniref:acyl carrier protein phosphodiesterase n=1 Tax=Pseudoalteromonas pernae TaxID=3118054 RepID=UPI00324256BF
MNYLAHLYLAQPTADSHMGNLLGDFRRGVDPHTLPKAVKLALDNHLLVDKFTDHHPLVKHTRALFSPHRRRFAGVATDVLFDHLLIQHWSKFTDQPFSDFCALSYRLLQSRSDAMPTRMQHVVKRMCEDDWFATYASLDGVDLALNNIAKRIRFNNSFAGAVHDIEAHLDDFNAVFLTFFPELVAHVTSYNIEQATEFRR